MRNRVVMTGANGFIGSHLQAEFKDLELETPELDISRRDHVLRLVEQLRDGDTLIHLAGASVVADCDRDPILAFNVNTMGVIWLSEALLASNKHVHVIFPSTAHVYQNTDLGTSDDGDADKLTESSPIRPLNTYGRSKRAAELILLDWAKSYRRQVTVLRLFNHTHHTQPPHFFLPKLFSLGRAAQESGKTGLSCRVGNLDLRRDVGSIADLRKAFRHSVEMGPNIDAWGQVFNICSGHGKTLRGLAQELFEQMKLTAAFEVDPALIRGDEPRSIVGDSSSFQRLTGWKPTSIDEHRLIQQFLAN